MAFPVAAAALGIGSLLGGLFGRRRRQPAFDPSLNIMQQQQQEAARAAAREREQQEQFSLQQQREEQERRLAEQQFLQSLSQARDSNYNLARSVIDSYGLNPQDFSDRIQSELGRMTAGLRPGADIANVINGRSIANTILDDELRRRRMDFGRQAEQQFGGNFADRFVQRNMLDDLVNDIVREQKQGALDFVDRGVKRGIFNQIGQNAALNKIGQKADIGRASISNLAGGIIDNYRNQLGGIRDQAFNAASGYNFGSNINFDELLGRASEVGDRARANAPGELRSALGGQNFFDLGNIRNAGGQAQGAINPRDTEIAAALQQRRRNASLSRGIGSQGAF